MTSTLDTELEKQLHESQEEIRNGNIATGLVILLDVFERSRECSEWAAARLSFVLSDLGRLAVTYDPARIAVIALRDECNKRLCETDDFNDKQELIALNRCLEKFKLPFVST